jgi:hypothetical protein
MRRSNSAITSGGNPFGKTGNGRSSTSPISSQWPVTESLPGDASAIRPNAPAGAGSGSMRFSDAIRVNPSRRRCGSFNGTRRATLPIVSLPASP